MEGKRTLVLDFDGVVHSYTSGWVQHNVIPDAPVEGAFSFITAALKHFKIAIFSSRSSKTMGIDAMRAWFLKHGFPETLLAELSFPTDKPPAFLTIDDRAVTFTGKWPRLEDLFGFQTWMQAEHPQLLPGSLDALVDAISELRTIDGMHIDIEPRHVLQQWVLDQVRGNDG
jgi:hypothetical protein